MKIISLFCGAGGMDLGFVKAGHKIIWANDNDEDCIETYKLNFCEKLGLSPEHVIFGDIKKIKSKDIPNGDIVIGGFPCQGFSIANPYRHTKDQRNKLYKEILRVIKDKKPKYFIAENVPGILSIGNGDVIRMIMNDFKEANYNAKYKILNAADFGVPQRRNRIIFLGVRNDVKPTLSYPLISHSAKPGLRLDKTKTKKWVTVRKAIMDMPEPSEPHNLHNHFGTNHKVKINGFVGNRKLDWDKPSPTVLGRGGGTGGPVIMPHPKLHRRLTVRECARLQSFPDDFIFLGSKSSQYRQIGNAVPWLLAFNIAKMLPKN